jgi:hypothetical protein
MSYTIDTATDSSASSEHEPEPVKAMTFDSKSTASAFSELTPKTGCAPAAGTKKPWLSTFRGFDTFDDAARIFAMLEEDTAPKPTDPYDLLNIAKLPPPTPFYKILDMFKEERVVGASYIPRFDREVKYRRTYEETGPGEYASASTEGCQKWSLMATQVTPIDRPADPVSYPASPSLLYLTEERSDLPTSDLYLLITVEGLMASYTKRSLLDDSPPTLQLRAGVVEGLVRLQKRFGLVLINELPTT